MATTQNLHTGNGTQTAYSFTFPYIDQADVKVELNGALTTAYTFANATTILFNSAPANGVLIDIYRDTDVDSVKAQFASGNAIKAQDLNKNFEQVLFATQEDDNRVGNFQSQIDVAVATANTASSNATTALNTANSISSSKLSLTGGTMSGDIAMGSQKVTNLADPTANQDAATKNYVDTQDALKLDLTGGNLTGNLGLGNNRIYSLGSPLFADEAATKGYVDNAIVLIPKLPLTGGTMSGDISFGNSGYGTTDMVDPTNAQDGATKNYVDTQNSTQDTTIATKLPLAGGTMSGAINMGSNLINNVTDPVSAQDAATKNYVDTANSTQDTAIAAKLPLAGGTMTGNITFNAGQTIDGYVVETSATGSAEIPAGTTAQRDASPSAGYIRFNTTSTEFEGYNGTAWTSIVLADGNGNVNIDSGTLYVDAVNNRVGVATNAPGTRLDVISTASASTPISRFKSGTAAGDRGVEIASDANSNVFLQAIRGSDNASNFPLCLNPNGGNVGIGTTSPGERIHVLGSASAPNQKIRIQTHDTASAVAGIQFYSRDASNNNKISEIATSNADLTFKADNTERMRIENRGIIYGYSTDAGYIQGLSNGAGTTYRFFAGRHSSTGANGSGTESYRVWSNGNVQNTNNSYGSLSDIKLKENIVDASSQWDDLKAIQVRKYNFKEETGNQTHTQLGVVAQEVELVSPGLVSESPDTDEDGNDLGTVTKSVNYSVLYMKAVKALQEAMERIETLEAKVAALESTT